MIDVDLFVQGYLDAILFTESIDFDPDAPPEWADGFNTDSSLLDFGCERESFTEVAVATLREDCVDFIAANEQALTSYCELRGDYSAPGRPDSFGRTSYAAAECAGTDFWLSRNGHGAGFVDRGNEPVFRELQDATSVYGSVNVYFDGIVIAA